MSILVITSLIEQRIATLSPALDTASENTTYDPVDGTPYQKVEHLPARPDNPVMGRGYREQGYTQVTLLYPPGVGAGAAVLRAEALQALFPKGLSITGSGYTVTINAEAYIGGGSRDGTRWAVPVKIYWHSNML